MDIFITILYFLGALSILIVVHEWGHFIAARLCGIRVEQFSIGFGPKIFGFKGGDTEYKISLLPLGGYVKMAGDELSELDKNDKSAFYNKPVWKRMLVVLAGPSMNFLLCMILMPIVFMLGKVEPAYNYEIPVVTEIRADSSAGSSGVEIGDMFLKVNGKNVANWKDFQRIVSIEGGREITFAIKRDSKELIKVIPVMKRPDTGGGYIGVEPSLFIGREPVLDEVMKGSPAYKAGLRSGDEVVAIDGTSIDNWVDMAEMINASKGAVLKIDALRDGEKFSADVLPEYNKKEDRYLIGIKMDITKRNIPMVTIRYGFAESVKKGLAEVWDMAVMMVIVIKKLVTLQLSTKSLMGPIGLAGLFGEAARSGLASFLLILSFVSLNLGFINLFPIPVLDGGHIVFFAIEGIRRKPLSEKIQMIVQKVGFGLLLALIVLVSINDILRAIR